MFKGEAASPAFRFIHSLSTSVVTGKVKFQASLYFLLKQKERRASSCIHVLVLGWYSGSGQTSWGSCIPLEHYSRWHLPPCAPHCHSCQSPENKPTSSMDWCHCLFFLSTLGSLGYELSRQRGGGLAIGWMSITVITGLFINLFYRAMTVRLGATWLKNQTHN